MAATVLQGKRFINGWTQDEDVLLVYYDSNQKRQTLQLTPAWYFYVLLADCSRHETLFASLKNQGLIKRLYRYPMNKDFVQVFCQNRNLKKWQLEQGETDPKTTVLGRLKEAGVQTFEGDLSSLKRLMIDEELKVADSYKTVFFDIETQDEDDRGRRLPLVIGAYPILSFAVEFVDGRQHFICHQNERYVLEAACKVLEAADLVATFNGNKFDLPYLKERLVVHDMRFSLRRLLHVDFFERMHELHKFNQEVEGFSLDALSKKFTPEVPKYDRSGRTIYSMFREYMRGDNKDLSEYNRTDVRVLRVMNEREHIIPFRVQLATCTGTFLSEEHKSWQIDTFVLQQAHQLGRPQKTKNLDIVKTKKYKGAFVMDPVPGRYEHVDVFDFAALYPNVIRSWNIGTSDDSMVLSPAPGQEVSRGATPNAEVYYRLDRPSMLSIAVTMFIENRNLAKAERDKHPKDSQEWKSWNLIQETWKILSNSTYGILGSPRVRYFDVRLAESITYGAKVLRDLTCTWFEAHGYKVIYGDTDSFFVLLNGADPKEVLKRFHADLPELVKPWGIKKPTFELAHEKHYNNLVLVMKKCYGGFKAIKDPPHEKFDGKGLSYRARSTAKMARKILEKLFKTIAKEGGAASRYVAWVEKIRDHFFNTPITPSNIDHFAIQKKVSKPPSAYAAGRALPLHVQIYQDLEKAGYEVWLPYVVRYVKVKPDGRRQGNEDGMALSLFPGSGREVERDSYWNTEIFGKIHQIVGAIFPDHDWDQYDTEVAAKRETNFARLAKALDKKKDITGWWSAFRQVRKAKLSPEQVNRLLAPYQAGSMALREKLLELLAWIKKRLEKYSDRSEIIEECCHCGPESKKIRGSRVTLKNRYTSTLCMGCGVEENEKDSDDDAQDSFAL